MEQSIQTTIHLFAGQDEMPVLIYGNATPGADAAKDSYGRPTECATAAEAYPTLIVVAGVEIITDADEKRAAEMFGFTVAEWNERIEEAIIEALDDVAEDYYDDDAIF